ncbi:MAG TPA: LLM class flavin-dependent oxidoreductase [Ktedonobacterales bacterium]|jgi:alkanesulfonate monooxygenase SsuD/methylene tetrahydromethanopterin reductase-like flavin-dependent oxidoreductase (luciferase family)|nr:LLM class flavin-dependent oxidoreductase [Ktedonobacterales bacterium]
MRFAINVPNFGAVGDARLLSELAREAEDNGWDGFFLWDHIGADWGPDNTFADPWIALTAIAMATDRISMGTLVTPLPRRRPWKVARETATLDRLSRGRLVLGVGIGSDSGQEYSCYGEPPDDKSHGAMLDEALDVITGLWTGEPLTYEGVHYQIHGARYLPTPAQHPRIPVWVAAVWPNKKPFRRAARWDGLCPLVNNQQMTPDELRDAMAYLRPLLTPGKPFDVLAYGGTPGADTAAEIAKVAAYRDAGATWWQEGMAPDDSVDYVRGRIRRGPPKLPDA